MVLNLDKTFRPFIGPEIEFEAFFFNGGEPHIKIRSPLQSEKTTVTTKLNSFNDLGMLLVAIDALKRLGAKKIELFIPYFPGARQDRVMVAGEALTVKVYADIINSLNLDKIGIFDPHSDVAPALLNNCNVLNNHAFISKVVQMLPKNVLLVSPDAGALKKIHKLATYLIDYEVLECGKSRNVQTGALSGFTVPVQDLNQQDCLIVDDICDGGGTFIGLAKELKKKNAGNLYLAVSHGIFSKGINHLLAFYESIFTSDSINEITADKLHIIPINQMA